MKSLVILCLFLSLGAFAEDRNKRRSSPVQEANLSDYTPHFDGYSANTAVGRTGTYILTRDHNSPEQIKLKLHKTFPGTNTTRVGGGWGINSINGEPYYRHGMVIVGSKVSNEKLFLDFSEAKELVEGEVEKIVVELGFRNGDIKIKSISVEDADRGEIDYRVRKIWKGSNRRYADHGRRLVYKED